MDCLNCGDPRHDLETCERPRHSLMRPPASPLTNALVSSLDGAQRGRRAGWKVAQSKAAQIVLHGCKDSAEGLALFKRIMDMVDG